MMATLLWQQNVDECVARVPSCQQGNCYHQLVAEGLVAVPFVHVMAVLLQSHSVLDL